MTRFILAFVALAAFLSPACVATGSSAYSDGGYRSHNAIDRAIHNTAMVQSEHGETFCSATLVKGTGLLLSAWHCFEGGMPFQIKSVYGTFKAAILVKDEDQDLAVLLPLGVVLPRRAGVPLARKTPHIGDHIYALGHAMGDSFAFTLTDGITSYGRRIGIDGQGINVWMQGTAPLHGGMSGGGTYNDRGELVGVSQFVMLQRTRCGGFDCPRQDSHIYGYAHISELIRILDRVS